MDARISANSSLDSCTMHGLSTQFQKYGHQDMRPCLLQRLRGRATSLAVTQMSKLQQIFWKQRLYARDSLRKALSIVMAPLFSNDSTVYYIFPCSRQFRVGQHSSSRRLLRFKLAWGFRIGLKAVGVWQSGSLNPCFSSTFKRSHLGTVGN